MSQTILIVDDTPATIGPLAVHLEDCGFRVVVAQDGTEGLARAQFVRPDLILMDVMMPGMDGFEACRKLKAAPETRDIPVIFMTALDEVGDKISGFEAGAVDYVTKPLQIAEVLARIATHLTLRSAQAELARARDELELRVEQRTADLRERESQIRRLVESNIIGISFWTMGGDIVEANDELLRMIGYTREDVLQGRIRWSEITPPEWREADAKSNEELRRTGTCTPYEKEYVRKDGLRVPILVGGALFEGSQDRGVAFVVDLSQRKRAEARIRYMAHHDALTGLPNRALLEDRLAQAVAQARREQHEVALLSIGLDDFKYVNESFGHEMGDRVLRAAGRRLQRCVRDGDSVARQSGDQFAVILSNVDGGDGAGAVAAKILEAFNRPFDVDGQSLRVALSIGISLFPTDGDDASAMLSAADSALFATKAQGRNQFQFFAVGQNEASRTRVEVANALHGAEQRGELVLHYQPQVSVATGTVQSAEALLRWRRGGKLVSCGQFIDVAEDTGLIVPIGEWVLREACRQIKAWRDAGHAHFHVAVNVSPRQLRRSGFHEIVASALERNALPPSALELEITEGMLMQQTRENVETLERLVAMGVRLSIDDFGVGYSNLGYLKRFPIHAIKIDQTFVRDIVQDPNDRAIVNAIIAMAKSLGMRTVAEGVETEEQAGLLQARGCDAMQGYLYGAPAPAEEFLGMLGTTHGRRSPAHQGD